MRAKSLFKMFPSDVPIYGCRHNPFSHNMMDRYSPHFDQSMLDGYWEETRHGPEDHFKMKHGRWTLPHNSQVRLMRDDWWARNNGGELEEENSDSWEHSDEGNSDDDDDEEYANYAGREIPIQWENGNRKKNWFGNWFNSEQDQTLLKTERDSYPSDNHDPWIHGLKLTFKDKKELQEGFMLSDKHVFAAQRLLRQQFPWVSGLQDTCLSQTKFSGVDSESVQIHHTRGNHWVLSAYLGGRLQVFDSIYSDLAKDLSKQLVEIYHSAADGSKLLVEIPSIPKQRGSTDCGLYAIALAYELCQGNNGLGLEFDQNRMRDHLLECFQKGELTSFPQRRVTQDCDVTSFQEIQLD